MKKRIIAIVLSVMIVMVTAASVYAVNTTGYYYTGSMSTLYWSSEPKINLNYSSPLFGYVCGGDVGAYFFDTSIGLQGSFIQSSSRLANVMLYEYDSPNSEILARRYQANFYVDDDMNYRPNYFANVYTNADAIENDGQVELYMMIYISPLSGDTSSSVPAELIKYKYWAY